MLRRKHHHAVAAPAVTNLKIVIDRQLPLWPAESAGDTAETGVSSEKEER